MALQIANLSIICFMSTLLVSILLIFSRLDYVTSTNFVWILPAYFCLINFLLRVILNGFPYQVAIRAAFLGFTLAVGIIVSDAAPSSWQPFGWYICVMSIFHYSEFLMIAITNLRALSLDSFILNHSVEYGIAAVASWVEFIIERYFFPDMKEIGVISTIGLILCVSGEALRKLAMYTAKTNFNHVVQSIREDGHQLVTHGVYNYFRHPSYVGWFYWSIGTQLILVNPVCLLAYAGASWRFFYDRIQIEEASLLNFFGEEYYRYQKKVSTGLPFIRGIELDVD